jgi:hypothetical protein
MTSPLRRLLLACLAAILAGCEAFARPIGPPPLEAPPTTPSPVAEVEFVMTTAAASGASFVLRIVDEVSGLANHFTDVPMQASPDGSWRTTLTPPVGSVLRYLYHRSAPAPADETTAYGDPIRYRLAVVGGSMVVQDIVAAWPDAPYSGPSGRIVGQLTETGTATALQDILVTAGGVRAFTDGEGRFRLEDLPPGLHNFAALSPSGAHLPVQQGAIVAADSATPAVLSLDPALPVRVSFEVTVPPDTPPGAEVRVIGDVHGLGNTFADLPGGQNVDILTSLPLIMVDATHYLALTTLYAGTDLHYKYTLGDGYWNAERSAQGEPLTRRVSIPAQESLTLSDVVSTWHGTSGGSLVFRMTAPASTPSTDRVSIQFATSEWTTPLPMWPTIPGEWTYTLHNPVTAAPSLRYRYCRNQQCGSADDVDTAGPTSEGRTAVPGAAPVDAVQEWDMWDPASGGATVIAPEILPRQGFEAGFEVLTPFPSLGTSQMQFAMAEMAAGGATTIALTPAWTVGPIAATPRMEFDPSLAPFVGDLLRQAETARASGLAVALHPRFATAGGDIAAWWSDSPRHGSWWSVWYELYRSFILTYAAAAEKAGAVKLILGGAEVAPALPGGALSDGSPSGAPADAEGRWRSLLEEVRSTFHGRLAWEVDYGSSLQGLPPFLDAVDEVHVLWHAPLGEAVDLGPEEMQTEAYKLLDTFLLSEGAIEGMPLVLTVEYLSINGAATGCAPLPDGSCRAPSGFDSGAIVDPDLAVDLAEQSAAINAVLLAAYGRESVHGFYVRGFHPAVALQDKSTSVRGKPAQQMLGYWYVRLTGR